VTPPRHLRLWEAEVTEVPDDLHYTSDHEWVRVTGNDEVVRVGITDFAQGQLGDVVYVDLPSIGQEVTAGQACGEVESTKSVSELYAPVAGVIVARNDSLEGAPDQVNTQPYGSGWLFEVKLLAGSGLDPVTGLLSAGDYSALTG
jgi:glycine cleavage system H protein